MDGEERETTMTTKTKKQTVHEQRVAFAEAVGASVDALGGRIRNGGEEPIVSDLLVGAAEREIDTIGGRLIVMSYADETLTRFDDPKAANARLPSYNQANPYSGKWNHHYNRQPPGRAELRSFVFELVKILPPSQVVEDPHCVDTIVDLVAKRFPDLRSDGSRP